MKLQYHPRLSKILLFASGLLTGILIFHLGLYFEREIPQPKRKKTFAINRTECLQQDGTTSTYSAQTIQKISFPLLRYLQKLTGYATLDDQNNSLETKTSKLVATGEIIRQIIDEEQNIPIPFDELDVFKVLLRDDIDLYGLKDEETDMAIPRLNLDQPTTSIIVQDIALKWETQSEPFFQYAARKPLQSNANQNTSSPLLCKRDFKAFANENLRTPSTLFITPYPLHMVYRKLKVRGRSDVGYCHSVILPDRSFSDFRPWHWSGNHVSEMDWPSIYHSDSTPEPNISVEFHTMFSKILKKLMTDKCWAEHFYMHANIDHKYEYFIEDQHSYQIFIKPLFFCLNSKMSKILEEYYKIVPK